MSSMSSFVAVNQTGGDLFLPRLGVSIPASGSLNLTDTFTLVEIQQESEIVNLINSGDLLVDLGNGTLNQNQSLNASCSPLVTEDPLLVGSSIQVFTGFVGLIPNTALVQLGSLVDGSPSGFNTSLFSLNADNIAILRSGVYIVEFDISIDNVGGGRSSGRSVLVRSFSGGPFAEVANTATYTYHRNAPNGEDSGHVRIELSLTDQFRIGFAAQVISGGALRFIPNGFRAQVTFKGDA